MNPMENWLFSEVVKAGASEMGIRLAAQLTGFEPCPVCDFKKDFCRCPEREQDTEHDE